MWEALLWFYLADAVLLIVHEIDSAYWQEWELFRLPGGIGGFVLLHIPLVGAVLNGLLEVYKHTAVGLVFAFVLAGVGVFAFGIHMFFIGRGHPEFRTKVSVGVLVATLLVSVGLGVIGGRV